jgi:ABC-type uncharacterized transport system permease subunit
MACLFFGLADAVQIYLQGVYWNGFEIPNQLIQISPYLVTLLALAALSSRMRAPKAINRPIGELHSN